MHVFILRILSLIFDLSLRFVGNRAALLGRNRTPLLSILGRRTESPVKPCELLTTNINSGSLPFYSRHIDYSKYVDTPLTIIY